MIRKVSVRGNRVTIDWDAKEEDFFFRAGLQTLVDDHSKGKKRVLVVPSSDPVLKGVKCQKATVNREFVEWCIGTAVNQALREYILSLEFQTRRRSGKTSTTAFQQSINEIRKLDKNGLKKLKKEADGLFGSGKTGISVPNDVSKGELVHKIGEDGAVLCGVKRVIHASTSWKNTTCPVCLEEKP